MKFYYKGKLIRTSKTHNYTHAVVREKENGEIGLWGCSSTYEGAVKALNQANRAYPSSANFKIVELESK